MSALTWNCDRCRGAVTARTPEQLADLKAKHGKWHDSKSFKAMRPLR